MDEAISKFLDFCFAGDAVSAKEVINDVVYERAAVVLQDMRDEVGSSMYQTEEVKAAKKK